MSSLREYLGQKRHALLSAFPFLAAAEQTRRIRLGTEIVILPGGTARSPR